MATHFIADLHLCSERPDLAAVFHRYLAGAAREAEALYILGDLFEYWIGDDGSLPEHQASVDALAAVASMGVNIFFMRGNRDFAVGPAFARAARLRILSDPLLINLYGVPTLLSHGDLFCTDDSRHQRFRARYSDPAWRRRMLRLPQFVRRQIARYARARSQANTRDLPEHIMDVNNDSVQAVMQQYAAQRLIHGHTHRPGVYTVAGPRDNRERIVLADWRKATGSVVLCDATGCQHRTLS